MRKLVEPLAVALVLLPSIASAQERAGDAALGALSGAVVLGPVGAVAGAVVGFTAGPSIAHSWGLRHGSNGSRARPVRQSSRAPTQAAENANAAVPASRAVTAEPASRPAAPAPSAGAGPSAPPVQGFE